MAAASLVSTSNVRAEKRRRSGGRIILLLCILFSLVIVFMWSEDLLEPLHRIDRGSLATTKSDFAWSSLHSLSSNDMTTKSRLDYELENLIEDDLETFFPPPSKVSRNGVFPGKMTPQSKKLKGDPRTHRNKIISKNQYKKHHKGLLRQRENTKERLMIVENTDDNIPMAAGGSVIQYAVDTLLCRDSVLDYVVNATDLKDECDGLKKAYTQTCSADGEVNEQQDGLSRKRRRNRRLATERKLIVYLEQEWSRWSHYIQSQWSQWFEYSVSTHRFLSVDENPDALDNSQQSDLDNDASSTGSKLSSILDQDSSMESQNKNKTSGNVNKKTLANLALPVNTKHVSGKMLAETLMLQQDNKIMKVVNQTNLTVTEAQADAAVSSKAVADAADMISNVLNDPTSVEARTCCTSILNVFHENCNINEEEELSDRRLFVGVTVIALCGLIKSLIRHFQISWLPEAAGCIMVGVTAGYILTFYPHHDISFDGKWFLRIMVPPIVFEAALSIDKRSFCRHIAPILFYALLGTLLATGVTAFVVHEGSKFLHCETIPYAEALAFGALISSIDPIAVLSVLSNMGMTDRDTIYVVIFGESLLNDGVAIVLFETLVHFLDDTMIVDSHAVTAAAIHFLVVFIGSLLIGLGYGLCCTLYYWVMFGCQTPLVEVLMFCCWALLPYYVCDGIEWSGIVAVVAGGFIMDMYVVGTAKLVDLPNDETDSGYGDESEKGKDRRRRPVVRRPIFSKEGLLSKEAKTHIKFVTEIIATMMETAIFAYLGLFLFSSRYHWNPNHVFIAISGCCISRAIMIPSLSVIANWITKSQQSRGICNLHIQQQFTHLDTPSNRSNQVAGVIIDAKMQLVLWFAGLRGAMSFALVEHIPLYDAVSGEGTRLKSELKAMTSACIIFTVFFLGGTTFYMMEALGMSPKSKSEHADELEMEMAGLLCSTTSNDTENVDGLDGSRDFHDNNESTSSTEMYTQTHTANNLHRPGRPVRRRN